MLFISERSRLPVIIPIGEARHLTTALPDALCRALAVVGISARDIARERAQMSEVAFGPTRSRSLLGTLTDYAVMAAHVDARRPEPESPEDLMHFLAKTPIMPLKGARPVDLTRAEFQGPAIIRTATR